MGRLRQTQNTTEGRRFSVGDRVTFVFDETELDGVVVEDFGNLGIGGQQMVRVRAAFDLDLVRDRAMFASALTLVNSAR